MAHKRPNDDEIRDALRIITIMQQVLGDDDLLGGCSACMQWFLGLLERPPIFQMPNGMTLDQVEELVAKAKSNA